MINPELKLSIVHTLFNMAVSTVNFIASAAARDRK